MALTGPPVLLHLAVRALRRVHDGAAAIANALFMGLGLGLVILQLTNRQPSIVKPPVHGPESRLAGHQSCFPNREDENVLSYLRDEDSSPPVPLPAGEGR